MAPSALPFDGFTSSEYAQGEVRPTKRLKISFENEHEPLSTVEDVSVVTIPPHPLGVKPSGNKYTATQDLKSFAGSYSHLPDELLVQLLETLDVPSLVSLGATCKALYAFTRLDELWRVLFVESPPKDLVWRGTWRSTYLSLPSAHLSHISCENLFSDVLYRPFQCAHTPLEPYTTGIPPHNAIPRLSDLTPEEFSAHWTDKPFILTSPAKQWPCFKTWTTTSLLQQHGTTAFRAEAVDWPLSTYVSYMRANADESPLYLFDCRFAEKMSLRTGHDVPDAAYWPPTCFGEDLFAALGPHRPDNRPDSRWLIVGPARSGSTFHKDPNATSAWNAVLAGRKYWLMFPSSPSLPPPPGVFVSPDGAEVTSPLSIAEYLLTFHAAARAAPGCREGVCGAGEVLHVPSGWFHLVLNLEEGIALTQNFVPRRRVGEVLKFLRDCPEQVSGFKEEVRDPYGLFVERLREAVPEVLEEGMRELERRDKGGRGRWEEIVRGGMDVVDGEEGEGEGAGFSFGFGDGDEDAEIP